MLVAQDQHEPTHERRVVRLDGRLEGGRVLPARRGHDGEGLSDGLHHGIGRSGQAPVPVAPTRWSTTMITLPSSRTEPGTT